MKKSSVSETAALAPQARRTAIRRRTDARLLPARASLTQVTKIVPDPNKPFLHATAWL